MFEVKPGNIHRILAEKMPADEIAHWYSDLYVKKTPVSAEIVARYEFKQLVTTFRDIQTGAIWYDIPFVYDRGLQK